MSLCVHRVEDITRPNLIAETIVKMTEHLKKALEKEHTQNNTKGAKWKVDKVYTKWQRLYNAHAEKWAKSYDQTKKPKATCKLLKEMGAIPEVGSPAATDAKWCPFNFLFPSWEASSAGSTCDEGSSNSSNSSSRSAIYANNALRDTNGNLTSRKRALDTEWAASVVGVNFPYQSGWWQSENSVSSVECAVVGIVCPCTWKYTRTSNMTCLITKGNILCSQLSISYYMST